MSLVVAKEHVWTISTDMWVIVEDSNPNPSSEYLSKIRVPVKDSSTSPSYESKLKIPPEVGRNRAVRELHILQLKHTLMLPPAMGAGS